MSLGRILLIAIFFLSSAASAQDKPKAATSAKRPAKSLNRFSIGLGFMAFGEHLQINDSTQLNNGYASYAGLAALVDHTWTKGRWINQAGLGFGSGKGTAGGFATISYPDSGRRTWTFSFLEFARHYRVSPKISLGAGLIAGNRSADWKSEANPAIKTKNLNKVIYAPELLMRWTVSKRLTLVQSIGSPDLRGNTIWRWHGSFNL